MTITIVVERSREFEEWYEKQPTKIQSQIDARISRIAISGHFGDTNPLGDGLFELKWRSGLRIYYAYTERRKIVLILGGTKHGQSSDIKKAKNLIVK